MANIKLTTTTIQILTLTCCALYIPQSFLTPGEKTPQQLLEGQKGSFLSIPIWGMGMAFIKTSVGLTLLRIQTNYWFKVYVWFNIAVACAYGFGNMWFILFSCTPLSAAWGDFANPLDAKCLPPSAIKIASQTGAVASVLTDVLISLAPVKFLWSLKRPLRERIVLGFLMGLGLLAGISSIVKNTIIANFGKPGLDMWAMNVSISTWTSLEMLLGTIAACIPFCRPVLERCFGAVGLNMTKKSGVGSGGTPGYAIPSSGYQKANARDAFRSKQATSSTKNLDRSESDEDLVLEDIELRGGVGIRKQTDIHVQSAMSEDATQGQRKEYYMAV